MTAMLGGTGCTGRRLPIDLVTLAGFVVAGQACPRIETLSAQTHRRDDVG
jgi:hypothetical protein